MRTAVHALLITILIGLPALGTPAHLAGQGPLRADRFGTERPPPGMADTCADDPACFDRTVRAGLGGYLAAALVMGLTIPTVMGACWEGCSRWVGLAWLSPIAVIPPLFMHLGSDRSGSLPATLGASFLTIGAGIGVAAATRPSAGLAIGTLATHFLITAATEVHWPRSSR